MTYLLYSFSLLIVIALLWRAKKLITRDRFLWFVRGAISIVSWIFGAAIFSACIFLIIRFTLGPALVLVLFFLVFTFFFNLYLKNGSEIDDNDSNLFCEFFRPASIFSGIGLGLVFMYFILN